MHYSALETAALYARLFAPHERPPIVIAAGIRITALFNRDLLVLLDQAARRGT